MIKKFDISISSGENVQQLKNEDMKGGIRRNDIKDEALRSIFDKLDDGNGILEQSEMEKVQEALVNAAKQDGDETNLSEKEAKSWLKALGLNNVDVSKLFEFLGQVKQISADIDYSTRDVGNPDEIIVVKKKDANGKQVTEIYDDKDGSLNRTIEKQQNGKTVVRDIKNNTLIGVDKNDKKFTRTQNKDGGYTDKYESGAEITYDKDGREVSGKNSEGITWTRTYNPNGSSVITWSNGQVVNYDKDGREVSGKNSEGVTWTVKYNEDGSYTRTFDQGEIQNYDKDGKLINAKLSDGRTLSRTYNPDGSYVQTWSDGLVENCDKDGRQVSGKNSKGITWTVKYNEDGSYTKTFDDGEIQNFGKDGKLINAKLSDGRTLSRTYNPDGSYVDTYNDGSVRNYDKDGKMVNGKLDNGTTYKYKYGDNGKLEYKEFTRKDGSKYYWDSDDKGFAEKTANGNIKASPKQGEKFNDTMLRLGITDPNDQNIFIKANPKAYRRGYFLLTDPKTKNYDVYIPKEIADKLDIKNILVDYTAEFEKHKETMTKKKASFGI